MKFVILIAYMVLLVSQARGKPQEKYSDKFDNMNVGEILSNKRLLGSYVNCLLDVGKCSPDGSELKKVLPDALRTNCEKCTDVQKTLGEQILKHMIDNEPEFYKKLEDKFDPDGLYKQKLKEKFGKDI